MMVQRSPTRSEADTLTVIECDSAPLDVAVAEPERCDDAEVDGPGEPEGDKGDVEVMVAPEQVEEICSAAVEGGDAELDALMDQDAADEGAI
eukprot:4174900-Pyramimonas_sp.AAC.1